MPGHHQGEGRRGGPAQGHHFLLHESLKKVVLIYMTAASKQYDEADGHCLHPLRIWKAWWISLLPGGLEIPSSELLFVISPFCRGDCSGCSWLWPENQHHPRHDYLETGQVHISHLCNFHKAADNEASWRPNGICPKELRVKISVFRLGSSVITIISYILLSAYYYNYVASIHNDGIPTNLSQLFWISRIP